MDFVTVVRDGINEGKKILREDGTVSVGGKEFQASEIVQFIKQDEEKPTAGSIYYAITQILRDPELKFSSYHKACESSGHKDLTIFEFEALQRYLSGQSNGEEFIPCVLSSFALDSPGGSALSLSQSLASTLEISTATCFSILRSSGSGFAGSTILSNFLARFTEDSKKRATDTRSWNEHGSLFLLLTRPGSAPLSVNKDGSFMPVAPPAAKKRLLDPPIIIVPFSPRKSIICLHNIISFFESNQFSAIDVRSMGLKQRNAFINRTLCGREMRFRVVDNPEELKDWSNVVCIVCSGEPYQFNRWKYSEPSILFRKYLGVYFHYSSDKIPEGLRDWKIDSIGIDRGSRHLDSAAVARFWRLLENFIRVHRPNLLN